MKIVKRHSLIITLFLGLVLSLNFLFLPALAEAQGLWDLQKENGMGTESGEIGEIFEGGSGEPTDPKDLIVSTIKVLFGFIGLFAVIMIIIGGFRWMNSRGNEEVVKKAKSTIIAAAIGLVIIISSYAITVFIMNMSERALNGGV
jgi:amino acid transporter